MINLSNLLELELNLELNVIYGKGVDEIANSLINLTNLSLLKLNLRNNLVND